MLPTSPRQRRLRTAAAPTPARMNVLVLPARMARVRIKTPAENEMLSPFVCFLDGAHRRLDQPRQFAIGLVCTLVGGVRVFGVRFYTRKRRSCIAFGCLVSATPQLCSRKLWRDFGHRVSFQVMKIRAELTVGSYRPARLLTSGSVHHRTGAIGSRVRSAVQKKIPRKRERGR
jgi:hypothetical protein